MEVTKNTARMVRLHHLDMIFLAPGIQSSINLYLCSSSKAMNNRIHVMYTSCMNTIVDSDPYFFDLTVYYHALPSFLMHTLIFDR